jgi:hypothetical protein
MAVLLNIRNLVAFFLIMLLYATQIMIPQKYLGLEVLISYLFGVTLLVAVVAKSVSTGAVWFQVATILTALTIVAVFDWQYLTYPKLSHPGEAFPFILLFQFIKGISSVCILFLLHGISWMVRELKLRRLT